MVKKLPGSFFVYMVFFIAAKAGTIPVPVSTTYLVPYAAIVM
jgi:hypothetical protein